MSNFKAPAAYRKSLKLKAADRANEGTLRIFPLTKKGKPSKVPHTFNNRTYWTADDAAAEVARLEKLNPGSRFLIQ